MAARFDLSPEGLTQSIVTPANSDCTWLGLFRVSAAPGGGSWRTFKYDGNDPSIYTQYVWVGQHGNSGGNARQLELSISGSASVFGSDLASFTHYWIAYVRDGAIHRVYLNGVLDIEVTQDVSGESFTHSFLGTDTDPLSWDPGNCAYYREWNEVKTATDLALEMLSATVVSPSGLRADTPLDTDGQDDSGNGNHWSDSGSTITYVDQPPTNAAAGGAISVTPLPYSTTQDLEAPISSSYFDVWYKYVAPADQQLSVFAYGGGIGELEANIFVYTDPNSFASYLGIQAEDVPILVPVHEGDTYWFLIQHDGTPSAPSPAILTLTAQLCADVNGAFGAGSLLVPDDTDGFRAAILSPTTGLPTSFVDFPAGESAFVLPSGHVLTEDVSDLTLKLYAPGLVFLTEIDWNPTDEHPGYITGRNEHFYVGNPTTATTGVMSANSVRLINTDGSFGPTTWTPTGYNAATMGASGALAVSVDESILYYHAGEPAAAIVLKAWDLINNVALPNVATGPAGYNQVRQILVLLDDTILVTYVDIPSPGVGDILIRRYDPSGAVLNTYHYTSTATSVIADNQIALALDDPDSFWFWHKAAPGLSNFINIRTSDGAELNATGEVPQFEVGMYQAGPVSGSPGPLSLCGHSESCPFLILPFAGGEEAPEAGVIGPLVWVEFPRRVLVA